MLALQGGTPVHSAEKGWSPWPVAGARERDLLLEVLDSGLWSYNGPKEQRFLEIWKDYTEAKHAFLVANGTVSLQLALEALDIGYGDEILVPAITWQATAAAVVDINAVPVLVDVKPETWCIDPAKAEEAVSERTKAIVPVHLYGNMADMDAVMGMADRHGLKVIEDVAHKHGAEWNGKKAGTIGDIGSFSLQLSKVLTCGEGGILVTSDDRLAVLLDALRNCGRRPTYGGMDKASGQYGLEGDLIQSGNYRITDFQAAVLIGQLERLENQNRIRQGNAEYLDAELSKLPGITVMKHDRRETRKAYFNYTFRYDEKEWSLEASKFREALSAELRCTVESCYQPLNDCTLYRPLTKRRYHINEEHVKKIDPSRFDMPVSTHIYEHEAVNLPHRVLLGSREDMDDIITAVKKISEEKGTLSKGAE